MEGRSHLVELIDLLSGTTFQQSSLTEISKEKVVHTRGIIDGTTRDVRFTALTFQTPSIDLARVEPVYCHQRVNKATNYMLICISTLSKDSPWSELKISSVCCFVCEMFSDPEAKKNS